jgi:hypothetical protein
MSLSRRRVAKRGSAVLMVFIILTIITAFVLSDNLVLWHLKQELRLIEKRQLQKYAPPSKEQQPSRPLPAKGDSADQSKPPTPQ